MPANNTQWVNDYTISRLLNYNRSAEGGKAVPPTQRGTSRVQPVPQVRVLRVQQQTGGTIFTLAWTDQAEDPSQPVDHYNIYVTGFLNGNQSPVGPYSALVSPATIFVPADANTPVTFSVQPVLANGISSSLNTSTSTSANALPPLVQPQNIAKNVLPGALNITGVQDGSNNVFVLSAIPVFLQWYKNGAIQNNPSDYTLVSNVVFTVVPPIVTDVLYAISSG